MDKLYVIMAGKHDDKKVDCYFNNREDADRYVTYTNARLGKDAYWIRSLEIAEAGKLSQRQKNKELLYIHRVDFYPKDTNKHELSPLDDVNYTYTNSMDKDKKGYREIVLPNKHGGGKR